MWPVGNLHGMPSEILDVFIGDDIAGPLVYGLIQLIADDADAKGLEAVGDRLATRIQSSPVVQEPFQATRLAHLAYLRAFDIESGDRSAYLAAKALSLEILLDKFKLEEGDDRAIWIEKRKKAEQLAGALFGRTAAQDERPRLQLILDLAVKALDLAAEAMDHNLQLALSLADWACSQTGEFGFGVFADPDGVVTARATALKLTCLEHMAEMERSLRLDWIALEDTEEAVYVAAYKARRQEDARRLANDVLNAGDQLATRCDDERRKIDLLDRLYKVSRITGDITTISDRLECVALELRRSGRRHEQAERWIEAANVYSNLGYRYFAAGEYTGLSRLYLLSIYYFEKSEVLRVRDPTGGYETDSDDPNMPEAGYRRLESEGFIYGASGRLAEPAVAADHFNRAAWVHERAARMVFGKSELHEFYHTASNFFDAQSLMTRAIQSNDLQEVYQFLNDAVKAFHECARPFHQVFRSYEAVLSLLVRGEPDPCSVDLKQELERTMHPDARSFAKESAALAASLTAGDIVGLRAAISSLSRLIIFLYPTG
jgi:hypothetical protein